MGRGYYTCEVCSTRMLAENKLRHQTYCKARQKFEAQEREGWLPCHMGRYHLLVDAGIEIRDGLGYVGGNHLRPQIHDSKIAPAWAIWALEDTSSSGAAGRRLAGDKRKHMLIKLRISPELREAYMGARRLASPKEAIDLIMPPRRRKR